MTKCRYEALYGTIHTLYRAGTQGTGKQALSNYLVRDKAASKTHVCVPKRKLRLFYILLDIIWT